jgi:hypothetical protein
MELKITKEDEVIKVKCLFPVIRHVPSSAVGDDYKDYSVVYGLNKEYYTFYSFWQEAVENPNLYVTMLDEEKFEHIRKWHPQYKDKSNIEILKDAKEDVIIRQYAPIFTFNYHKKEFYPTFEIIKRNYNL